MNDPKRFKKIFDLIFDKSGFDFRDYSDPSLERCIENFKSTHKISSLAELQQKIASDFNVLHSFIDSMTIQVTEMFRDPSFYLSVREMIIDALKSYEKIKIWHAGCSTGAEVYSMAILFQEEGLLSRTQFYATDINESSLKKASDGIFELKDIKLFEKNYHLSGGKGYLCDYYNIVDQKAIFNKNLRSSITFSFHNLATDGSFTEAHFVICRNVLIYFNEKLQNRVLELIHDSLIEGGILALGDKETLLFTNVANKFKSLNIKDKIYQKAI